MTATSEAVEHEHGPAPIVGCAEVARGEQRTCAVGVTAAGCATIVGMYAASDELADQFRRAGLADPLARIAGSSVPAVSATTTLVVLAGETRSETLTARSDLVAVSLATHVALAAAVGGVLALALQHGDP